MLLACLAASPCFAQEEEETTIRRVADPDEETSLMRRSDNDDEETSLMRRGDDEDEGTSLVRRTSTIDSAPVDDTPPPLTLTGRFNGYYYGKFGFDFVHDGNQEDVFDFRNKFGLSTEVSTNRMIKVFLAARFSHYVVGQDAGDDTWLLFNSNSVKRDYEAELREAYLYWPNDIVNIRVGNQIVRWGYGQFNKPSDVLNPVDYREGLFSDLEVPLIPNFMVHLDRSIGPANLSVVWIPFFKPNRTNLFGQDWAPLSAMYGNPAFSTLGMANGMVESISSLINPVIEDDIQPLLLGTNPPENKFENGQWGAKTEFSAVGIDFQLSYLYGWDKMPWVQVNNEFLGDLMQVQALATEHPEALAVLQGMTNFDPDNLEGAMEIFGKFQDLTEEEKAAFQGAMQAVNRMLFEEDGTMKEITLDSIFQTSYHRQHTLGLSASTVLFDRIGLKLDAAYSPSRTVFLDVGTGFPAAAAKPAFSYSIGLDYQKSSKFDIMLEFYHFHVMDLKANESVFVIGSDLYMLTLATHLRLLDFEALELQLAGMMEFNTMNMFLFPKVSYMVNDRLRLAIGAFFAIVLPGGDDMGPAGLFDRNDSVYLDVKFAF